MKRMIRSFLDQSRQRRLLAGIAVVIAVTSNYAAAERIEKKGIAIDFSLKPVIPRQDTDNPVAGHDAVATFRISDVRTGQPLTGIRPRAWLSARHSEMVASETECTDKIRTLASGNLVKRADIDLNKYQILTLNHDKTITIINPLIAFNATKLENIVVLPANGADWVLSGDRKFLYVTLPEASAVAVIDTTQYKLVATISTGEKTTPRRIAIQPDGRYVWVDLDGAPQVVAIDTSTRQIAGKITTGSGSHRITFTANSHFAYISSSAADTVTAVDTLQLTRVADIGTGKTPTAIAYSTSGKFLYISAMHSDMITVLDPDTQRIVTTIPVFSPGITTLAFAPGERYLVAVNQLTSTMYAIDSATNTVIAHTPVVKEPDQIVFSNRYLYIRGLGSEKFSLIDLSELKNGKVSSLDIQAGQLAPAMSDRIGIANMIAPTPGGNAVLIANPADQTLYYYQEGMMAPMGTFSNYKRVPLGLIVLDRSLAETAPGIYSVVVRPDRSGRFDVPILIDQPRLMNCFQVTVAEQPGTKNATTGGTLQIEALFDRAHYSPGQLHTLSFRVTALTDKQPVQGLPDVQALIIEAPGLWQQRRRLKETGEGIYSLQQTFPHAGSYQIVLAIPSRRVRYTDLQPVLIQVAPPENGAWKSATTLSEPEAYLQ